MSGFELVGTEKEGAALATAGTSTCTSGPVVTLSIPVDHKGAQIAVQSPSVSRGGKRHRTTDCDRDSRGHGGSRGFVRDY